MKFKINSEERFDEGFLIDAEDLTDAEKKTLDLIDIHEVDDKGEIKDGL